MLNLALTRDNITRWTISVLLVLCPTNSRAMLGAGGAKLDSHVSAQYRQWFERDVAYIITKEEKAAFLKLTKDQDRDRFIERFWEIRNPTPGAPSNPYKEKHYRRLEYANQHFGHESGLEGWRTEQGRVWITLGPPQQRAFYINYRNIRPMEIWFYSSSQPALPPFYSVVFYEPDVSSGYRFYSPYLDGPEKLVTTLRAANNRVGALRVIQDSAGNEVARTVLSLLPDEPVDLDTATASLQSDVLLSHIRNLADDPITKRELERRRQLVENVTSRLILGGEFLDLLTVPLRDSEGNTNLHYVLRLKRPADFGVGRSTDGRYYYSVLMSVRVSGVDDAPILTRQKKLSAYLDEAQLAQIRNKVFGYEGWLPLPPGKYKLEFALTNLLKQTAYRAEKEVVVPEIPQRGFYVTPLVSFSKLQPVGTDKNNLVPFSAAGMRFEPLATDPFWRSTRPMEGDPI